MFLTRFFMAGVLLTSLVITVKADEWRSTLQDQQSVAVTIYNDNLALVKDQRKIRISSGSSTLAFRDVSSQIRPETALLRSLTDTGKLSVTEQNFDYDLLTPAKLLEKYVGKTVNVIRTNIATGVESSEQAEVLAASSGVVLKIGNRIETGIPGRISYPDVPDNLRDRPTLVMLLNNGGTSLQDVELSYLTGGLGWRADYVAELNAADDKLDLSGWVTLTNTSGATYRNARLQLVAGDVNQVHDAIRTRSIMEKSVMMAPNAPIMAEESLLEYHLYTLDHPTTLAENQTKQVSLLYAHAVPVHKEFLLRGNDYYYRSSYGELGQKMKIGVFIEFANNESAHLGQPLPKGIIRVYKKDLAGNAQFVGEDRIDHTPKNEKVRLKLGEAFDVTADKKQTDFKKMPDPSRTLFESAYEIVLKNAKSEDVTVTIQEPIPSDWKILQENYPHQKATSNTAIWRIRVPAQSHTTLNYRVQVRY
jgi:hypothetical protein